MAVPRERPQVGVLSRCRHPNLVLLMGFCVEPGSGTRFLVYEYLDGGDLRQLLNEGKRPLVWSQRVELCADLTRGLAYLHGCSILHRDVKPSNLLVEGPASSKLRRALQPAPWRHREPTGTRRTLKISEISDINGIRSPACRQKPR